ncbi:SoxR reducing system RseC family protein [Azonexus sp. IMCC34842]|uniref:SoxR reducing system RseC family protein n=1 Tax=Azonexus sp. IMCC34842 TaxID=3420950 RepID=UPI003D0A8F52
MSAKLIEHWGMVKRIDDGRATIVVETTACGVCGHGGHCCICKAANGGLAAMLNLPAANGLKEGDFVNIGLPESGLSLAALLGYFFPALATLVGIAAGASIAGSDAAMALGGAAGFAGSLVVARIAIDYTPGLSPAPQLIPVSNQTNVSQQEFNHER